MQLDPPSETLNSSVYQFRCSFVWSHKRLYSTFFPYAVVLSKTYKYISMCEIGEVQASQHQPVEVKLIGSKLDLVYPKKNLGQHMTVLIFIQSPKLAKKRLTFSAVTASLPCLFKHRAASGVHKGRRRWAAALQLQPQVRVRHSFTGKSSLKGEATVFSDGWRMSPQGGALLLYDGPEHRREGELSGQHS